MTTTMTYKSRSAYEAPPPYAYATSCASNRSSSPSFEASPLESPPEFSIFPLQLSLEPGSTIIRPSIGGAGLYELSTPLNTHPQDVLFSESGDGTRGKQLYRIHEAPEIPRDPSHTGITALQKSLYQGTILRRGFKGCSWSATSHGESWIAKGDVIFSASQQQHQSLSFEWRDQKGKVVAMEYRAGDRRIEEERLEIVKPLGKKALDMMIAIWIARVYQDCAKDAVKEAEEEKRRRKVERRRSSGSGGKQGLFHDVRSRFGLGND